MTIDANSSLESPLKLDFSMNDPTELEQIYYRSDHYSYAVKGIPIVFVFTGLHADYHANTDSADKINYEKMARIGQLVHEIGMRVGASTTAPVRDRRGPRAGKMSSGKL
jgi:Zn-dependent M28 family amino/carboxypeptidase